MTVTEMYRFNEDAVKSEEMQKYLDAIFQQLIDKLSDKINEGLETAIKELSVDLNTYAKCKGYEYSTEEAAESLESNFPGIREKIHDSIEESTLEFQKKLLAEAK